MKRVKLFEEFLNEGLRADLKKFIKKNEDELNQLADEDQWDRIELMLQNEFDVQPNTPEAKDLLDTFMFIF